MAGPAHSTHVNSIVPAPVERTSASSPKRSLPNGPCNYKNLAEGPCGCNQFWDKCSAELHEWSNEKRLGSERSTWCVCGHHACFHAQEACMHCEKPSSAIAGVQYRASGTCDGRCQLQTGFPCDVHKGGDLLMAPGGSQNIHSERMKTSHASPSQRFLRYASPQANFVRTNEDALKPTSQPSMSTSGLPRVPSVCFLPPDLHSTKEAEARQATSDVNAPQQTIRGLGLELLNTGDRADRPQSATSTIPDDIDGLNRGSYSEPGLSLVRAHSIPSARGALDSVLQYNRTLHLDVGSDTLPNTYNPDEFLQSATEVATPSNSNTPNLGAVDHTVQEAKKFVESLTRLASNDPNKGGSEPAISTTEKLQAVAPYLAPIHNLLNTIPTVATTIRDINTRLDLLENRSFNHVHPEDVQHQFEMYEGRVLELEHRMDEHDRLHQTIDGDHSSNSRSGRRIDNVNDSFVSNHSLQSTTSSALILAAMDRKEIETEFEGIKDRLDILEATALPTSVNPWEIEVVLLPWGQDLRGIWYSSDESMHDPAKGTTQDAEEWTQGRIPRSNSSLSHGGNLRLSQSSDSPSASRVSSKQCAPFSDAGSGWSSQAISDWASGAANELLSPKACGSNNLVYKRLQSRGFVRDVTFKSPNSRDIQATLSSVFNEFLDHLKYTEADEHPTISSYPGLHASFIPLRKVVKESRLRFLTNAEMASSALWSAQFLASGVMMRVSGGKKRLYVTQRESYMQQDIDEERSWTWQRLRELPRFDLNTDSHMEGNEEISQTKVAEADAREACWATFEALDQPLSITTSFGSNPSVQLSMRPAERQWRRSITPSSILKNKHAQPLSPSSTKRRYNASPVKQSSIPQSYSRAASVVVSKPKRRRVAQSASPHPEVQNNEVATLNNVPQRFRALPSPVQSSHPPLPRTNSDATSRSQRSVAVVGKSTPFAYATPYSGPIVPQGSFGADQEGDTEPDDDYDDHEDDDDEQSWRGVEDGEEEHSSSSDDEHRLESELSANFSGDDNSFGSSGDDDDEDEDGEFGFGAQRQNADDNDSEEVYDTLLSVLRG